MKTARRVLQQALDTATSRGDVSYVAAALGQLAWNQGDYDAALKYYARALAADDSYLPALEAAPAPRPRRATRRRRSRAWNRSWSAIRSPTACRTG